MMTGLTYGKSVNGDPAKECMKAAWDSGINFLYAMLWLPPSRPHSPILLLQRYCRSLWSVLTAGVFDPEGALIEAIPANGESEKEMGRCIKELGWNRDELVISTKIFL